MANEFKVKNGLIVIGDLTTSGTITINGALAATQSWVTSQAYLTSASLSGYATQSYVTSAISSLIDAAPAALDTLNELAAALGDDANFSTTITNSIASKQAQLNGTGLVRMSGTSVSYDNTTYLISNFGNIEGEHGYGYPSSDGWYKIAEIVLTSSCQSFNLWGEYRDTGYFDNSHYRIHITARAECDFPTNNESHAINVNMYGSSTNETYFNNNVRVVLTSSSSNYRKYELQYYRATWDTGSWNLQTLGWTTYTTSQTAGTPTGTPRVYYISKFVADNIYAANKISIGTTYSGFAANIAGTTYVIGASVWVNDGYGISNASSGGTGFFPYSDGTLVFNSANSEKMRVASSGNVGIGTNSPGYKLEVNGGATGNNIARFTTGGAGGGTRGLTMYSDNSQLKLQVSDNAGGIGTWAFLNLNPDGGNVGVGTTSPDSRFTVKGDNALVDVQSTADGQTIGFLARYLNSATLGGAFRYTTGDAQLYIDNFYEGNNGVYSDINIRNCDTGGNLINRIKIKGSSGNVGIGTNNPIYKLQVAGSTYVNGGTLFLDSSEYLRWGNSNQGIVGVNDSHVAIVSGGATRQTIYADGRTYFPGLDLSISNVNSTHGTGTYFRGDGSHFVFGLNNGNTLYLNYGNSSGALRTFGTWYHESTQILSTSRVLTNVSGNISMFTNDAGYLTSVSDIWVNTAGDTMTGSLLFADVADNVRLQKGSSFLNLRDSWNNTHLSNGAGGGHYFDASHFYLRTTGGGTTWLYLDGSNFNVSVEQNNYSRVYFRYNVDRYSQTWYNSTTGAYWWVTTDADKLGFHRNGDGDKFYFGNTGDFYSATNGWLSTALAAKQNASTAINTSNIGSQSVSYANSAGYAGYVNNQSGQLLRYDNRIISPSETNAAYLQFGFTSWDNNGGSPYADYLHMRSYDDGSGGNDNLVMFLKSGIGMRIYQQTFGSATAYSSYADVWTTANFTSSNISNWNTAYGWGNHASAGYLTSYSETDTLQSVTSRGNSTYDRINVRGIGNQGGGNIMMGNVGEGTNKWSYLTSTHYNASSQPQGFALIGGLATSGGNAVVIGGNIYETNPATEIQFWTHSTNTHNLGGTQRGVINSAGNWGIGTTSPNQRLSVEGGSIQLNANNVAANYYLNLNKKSGQDGGIVFTRDNAADWQLTNGAGNGDLIFYSYGTSTEAITFKRGTGNVGIGTTNPGDYKLYVNGGQFGTLLRGGDLGTGSDVVRMIKSDGSAAMIVRGDGNVGIGIFSPQKKLDVFGGAGIVASLGASISPGQFVGLHFGYSESYVNNDSYKKSALVFERTDNHGQGGNASGKIHFLLNNIASTSANALTDSVVTIDSDASATVGSVRMGIGTRTPTSPLEITNTGSAGGGLTMFTGFYSSLKYWGMRMYGIDNGNGIHYSTDVQVGADWYSATKVGHGQNATNPSFQSYYTTYLATSGGNVGIGTTSPSTKLDVSGVITATGGNSTNWNTAYGWGNHASYSYATTSYVTTQINNLIAGAPGALDTLDELAAALGDDSNFATTVTNSIAGKVSKSGDTMTGNLTLKYDTSNTPDYNALLFATGSDDYIIKASTTQGVFGRQSFGWHVAAGSAFGVYSSGWVKLFGVEGGTGNTQIFGNLTVNGTITESSSLKLKENIKTSEGNLEKVVNLRPVTYNKIGSQTTELGLIAEEVAEVYPEFVQYDENGEPIGVNYSRLTAALIGAVKELTNQVQELNKKING